MKLTAPQQNRTATVQAAACDKQNPADDAQPFATNPRQLKQQVQIAQLKGKAALKDQAPAKDKKKKTPPGK